MAARWAAVKFPLRGSEVFPKGKEVGLGKAWEKKGTGVRFGKVKFLGEVKFSPKGESEKVLR